MWVSPSEVKRGKMDTLGRNAPKPYRDAIRSHTHKQAVVVTKTPTHSGASDLSLILLVRSTASMSMRILYLTCGGTLVVQGYMSMKTTPAQNLFSSSRYKAIWLIWDSSVYATNLSRSMHCEQREGRSRIKKLKSLMPPRCFNVYLTWLQLYDLKFLHNIL